MNYKFFLLVLTTFLSHNSFSQNQSEFELFPNGLNFIPLKANNQEARLGLLYYTSTTNLKVDIGNSVDLLAFEIIEKRIKVTTGIEFMAYAFSKSYAGQRLQISAVDGFFGGNVSFSKQMDNNKLLARFRIIHNSAHLVDGSYDTSNNLWIDNKEPVPFTKDFGEITIAHQHSFETAILKYYGGLSYATLIRPDELKRYSYHLGFEIAIPNSFGKVFENDLNLFAAEHFFLDGTEKYFGSQQIMVGGKIGKWDEKGIVMYASYYSGREMFSSYYDKRISKFGIGFFIDFF